MDESGGLVFEREAARADIVALLKICGSTHDLWLYSRFVQVGLWRTTCWGSLPVAMVTSR